MTDQRRALPAVHTLMDAAGCAPLVARHGRARVGSAIRLALDAARRGATDPAPSLDAWIERAATLLTAEQRPSLQRVINATGVVLHTNLGRAPLAAEALAAITDLAAGYSNLEFDLDTGSRGSRLWHARDHLIRLTGAQDALVVNNCAAGLVLALRALADGRDAVISRGELVEIGGGFRVPEIMAQAGVQLVEVGTTNRTHADDFRRAAGPRTGAFVKVHRSNFAMSGFVADVPLAELAAIGAAAGVPVIHDFGSGLLVDLSPWGLDNEPTARDMVAAGADVVVMSGDKLLGGPQCGILLGTAHAIARLREHPLARAVRVDKLTLAALEATLSLSHDATIATRRIPALRMITADASDVTARARALAAMLAEAGLPAAVTPSTAAIGGGAFPAARLASTAVVLEGNAADWAARLRAASPAIVGVVRDDRFLLDARTIDDTEVAAVAETIVRVAP